MRNKNGLEINNALKVGTDSVFNLESYIMKEFTRRIGAKEEEAFFIGDGTEKPTGIFNATGGAQLGVTAASATAITLDEIMHLFYSLKSPYRKNIGGECMVLTLEEVKLYLRVDGDEENTLITKFILTLQELCEEILRFELTEYEVVPELARQAILYAVVNMYEQRENFDVKAVIDTMIRLLFSYRRESW